MAGALVCMPKRLSMDRLMKASALAVDINPINFPPIQRLTRLNASYRPTQEEIAVVTEILRKAIGVLAR